MSVIGNRKWAVAVCLIVVLSFFVPVSSVLAQGCRASKDKKGRLSCRFMCQAHYYLKNAEVISLTADQRERIQGMMLDIKKELIRLDADISIVKLDLCAKLGQDAINSEDVNALIDLKYDLKKTKSKTLLKSVLILKNILTDEQRKLLKAHQKDTGCAGYGQGASCPYSS